MPNVSDLLWGGSGRVPLLVGAVLLYAASRAAVNALAANADAPGRRAVGHWIPIAAAAIVASLLQRPDLALSILFCTSVAALSLVLGSVLLAAPDEEAPFAPRRLWPLALPVTLIPLLAGFAGRLTWIHAGILIVEGVALLMVWLAPQNRLDADPSSPSPLDSQSIPRSPGPMALRPLNFLLAAALAAIGAFPAIKGTIAMGDTIHRLPTASNLIVVALLGPLLAVPILIEANHLAHSLRAWTAVTVNVGIVMLNLCCLLPVVILLGGVHVDLTQPLHVYFQRFSAVPPLVFPIVVWRVDNVVLVLLAFLLIPAAMGRWRLGRSEGLTLLALYFAYVLMEMLANLHA